MDRIELHKAFWAKSNARPVVSLRTGGVFPAKWFSISRQLLAAKKEITPDMLSVDKFLPDYERMYNISGNIGCKDSFWTAQPYAAIPWIEAMLGCRVFPGDNSFVSVPCISEPGHLKKVRIDFEGAWVKKYCEFLTGLTELSGGRFPVGQPIMRGLLDCLGAVIGQTEGIYAIYDNADEVETFFRNLCDDFISLIRIHFAHVEPFYNGSSAGMFHSWAPGKCLMYQDDLISIASPAIFENLLKDHHKRICSEYPYSVFHTHPASYIILDNLLAVEELGAVQTSRDEGGKSVVEMLPYLLKILERKKLILSGNFTFEELDVIFEKLPAAGLFLDIVTDTLEEASAVAEYIEKKTG